MEDWNFRPEAFVALAASTVQSLYTILGSLEELDSRLQVLQMVALIVERVDVPPSYDERGVLQAGGWLQEGLAVVVGPLPQVGGWAGGGGERGGVVRRTVARAASNPQTCMRVCESSQAPDSPALFFGTASLPHTDPPAPLHTHFAHSHTALVRYGRRPRIRIFCGKRSSTL